MNLLNSFINNHLPRAKKEENLAKSIIRYSGENKIFVIGLGGISGIITQQKKDKILRQLNSSSESDIYFFTLFDNNETFQKNSYLISWGSYVWIATQPEHTIHFDKIPKLKARLTN